MTPEQDITQAIADVCPESGHWPYTRNASLYVGFRPRDDGPWKYAANKPKRVAVVYDVVVAANRGRLNDMETLRYALYEGLRQAGWLLADIPGPETYNAQTQMYLWPFSVTKGFDLDQYGQPQQAE
jgi:hypothetical protein